MRCCVCGARLPGFAIAFWVAAPCGLCVCVVRAPVLEACEAIVSGADRDAGCACCCSCRGVPIVRGVGLCTACIKRVAYVILGNCACGRWIERGAGGFDFGFGLTDQVCL